LQTARNTWQEKVLSPLTRRFRERRERFTTSSDAIEVQTVYTPLDVAGADEPGVEETYLRQQGLPGEYPFTRGVQPTMYRGRLWTMRQYAGFGTAAESNQRYQYLLAAGQTGLSVAFDLPTQMGYDPDDPMAQGEVGRVGVSIASVEDMHLLMQGIPLDKVSVSMTINATATTLLPYLVAVAEERGLDPPGC
jgi:methylmalonyl-CoA mutase N-terminal domain/subunit